MQHAILLNVLEEALLIGVQCALFVGVVFLHRLARTVNRTIEQHISQTEQTLHESLNALLPTVPLGTDVITEKRP